MELSRLRNTFQKPPREFGPTPFMALNDDLNPVRLRAALQKFADQGCAGVFMHARTGLEVPYLSDEFFARIGVILDECRKLGLKAWIYDEYNWPSGVAGGRVLDAHPEFLAPYLEYANIQLKGEGRLDHPGQALAAFAIGPAIQDLSEHIHDRRWEPPPDFHGDLLLFYEDRITQPTFATNHAPWCSGVQGYLDLLNPDAVRAFMELTHFEYARRFPEHLGSTIPGVFTDEPQLYNGFPWTGKLRELFRERKGYDLVPLLYMLVLDRGDFRRVRCDYYEAVERLYAESFYEQFRKWCDEHKLILTGHLGMEERLRELSINQGGVFRPLQAMHQPGIDALGWGDPVSGGLINMEVPNFSPRAAAAISRTYGHGRVLCEAGGGGGWEVTPEKLKRMHDWLFASGVNFINPHQSLFSIKGLRKRDFPPSHFVQEPWFEYYRESAEYIARLSMLMSEGEAIADLGLLVPMAAIRAVSRGRGAALSEQAQQVFLPFQSILEFLVQNQRDFELVFEEFAEDGQLQVQDRKLMLGRMEMKVLIVPPCPVIAPAAADLLAAWLEAGGRAVLFDQVPRWDTAGNELTARLLPMFRRASEAGRAVQLSSRMGFTREGVLSAFDRICPPALRIEAPFHQDISVHRRRIGAAEVYFMVNLGEQEGEAVLRFRDAQPVLEVWDPVSGGARRVPFERTAEGSGAVALSFQAGESMVLVLSGEGEAAGPGIKRTNLKQVELVGNKVRGLSAEGKAVVEKTEGKLEQSGPVPPLPIALRPEWEIQPEKKNVFLIEPWNVTTEVREPLPLSGLAAERYFTGRTRRLIKLARPLIKFGGRFRPFERRYRTERYFSFADSERAQGPMSRLTGIDLSRWGLYEGIAALHRFSDYLGFHTVMKSFPPAGAEYEARAKFDADFIPEDLALVYEDLGTPVEFEINGQRIQEQPENILVWDACNRALPVARYLRRGKNRVKIRGRQLDWFAGPPNAHSLEPVALLGDFAVKGRKLTAPAKGPAPECDWRRRGYPFYSGPMNYRTRFNLPEEYLAFALFLELTAVRECAEVFLNGKSAGVRLYPPFHYPITGLCRAGENELTVRVVNTAANLLGRPQFSGLDGVIRIVPYHRFEVELGGET